MPVTDSSLSSQTIDLNNTGYVVTTLQAGLYYGLTAETATDAIVDVVMMGGDADTLGAVAGTIACARFGIDFLPGQWLETIDETAELKRLGATLARESFVSVGAFIN